MLIYKQRIMNIRIITPILFLVALIPIVSVAAAQNDATQSAPSVQIIYKEEATVYVFVQIIHRDSSGNLMAYIETDRVGEIDKKTFDELIQHESSQGLDPVYNLNNGKSVEVISRQQITEIEETILSTDTELLSTSEDGKDLITLRMIHDGYMAYSGDTVTTYWNFVRTI